MFFVDNSLKIGGNLSKSTPEDAACCAASNSAGLVSVSLLLSEQYPENCNFRRKPPFGKKLPLVATRHVHTRFGIPSVANTQDCILSTTIRQTIAMEQRGAPVNLFVIFAIGHAQITFPVLGQREYTNHL